MLITVRTKQQLEKAIKELNYLELISLDTEFNTLDVFNATLFLVVLGNHQRQYVIHARELDISPLNKLSSKTFIGHNISIDLKILALNGVKYEKAICTMVIEQRLHLGKDQSNSLASVTQRYLNLAMDKEERLFFVNKPKSLQITSSMEAYAAKDIEYIEKIYNEQKKLIKEYDMEFLIYGIELPLISILAYCDLEGIVLNIEKWKANLNSWKEEIIKIEEEADNILVNICKGTTFQEKYCSTINQTSLFDLVDRKVKFNYSSSTQFKELFKDFKQVMPTIGDKETFNKDAITEWLNTTDSIFKSLMELMLKRSKLAKKISTYGESFVDMIKSDNKLHTVFKQCFTNTGRLSSGNSKYGYPNFQNIPADNSIRHCFGVEEGYEVTTVDLSGAELIILCSLAQDYKLLELSTGDMHSHMANLCWEKIYKFRNESWTSADVISKEQNKSKRNAFKAITFGCIYGMREKKCSLALKINTEEAKIVIEAIKEEIPCSFEYVEEKSKEAITQGYVIHNKRTNSRRWFSSALYAIEKLSNLKKEKPDSLVSGLPFELTYKKAKVEHIMDFKDRVSVESEARNCTIQGTQADVVKEAMVVISKLSKQHNLDITLLMQVHDELVYKSPVNYSFNCPLTNIETNTKEFIELVMKTTANLYLEGVTMGAEGVTCPTWTK